jgi:hypothetical protein
MRKLDAVDFPAAQREKLLNYKSYSFSFGESTETLQMISEDMSQSTEVSATVPPGRQLVPSCLRHPGARF